MNVTLEQLRVLEAVAATGSVTAAAARLHRAQSAVSYGLRTLEAALELTLVDRSGYRAGLTDAGRAVLLQGRTLLQGAAELEHLAQELREGAEPLLSVLIDAILPTATLMPVLRALLAQGLPTRLDLRMDQLGGLARSMETLQPALVLAPLGLFPLPPGYAREVLGTITMIPVVAADHPLAAEPAPVPLATVRRHPHLVITSPPGLRTLVDTWIIDAPVRWNVPDFHTRLEALREGLGFAWMPTYMVEVDVAAGRLVPLALEEDPVRTHEVGLIYRTRPPLGRTGRFLLDLLRERTDLLPPVPVALRARCAGPYGGGTATPTREEEPP